MYSFVVSLFLLYHGNNIAPYNCNTSLISQHIFLWKVLREASMNMENHHQVNAPSLAAIPPSSPENPGQQSLVLAVKVKNDHSQL